MSFLSFLSLLFSSAARVAKAEATFPRPTAGLLRPIVRAPTLKYNTKQRLGRGFTLEELKAAGIPAKLAPTIGVAVDARRVNRSEESLQTNVERLKAFKAALVVFPRRAGKPKAGDAAPEELKAAAQLAGPLFPVEHAKPAVEFAAISDEAKAFRAYQALRAARTDAKLAGIRKKKAEAAAAAAKDA